MNRRVMHRDAHSICEHVHEPRHERPEIQEPNCKYIKRDGKLKIACRYRDAFGKWKTFSRGVGIDTVMDADLRQRVADSTAKDVQAFYDTNHHAGREIASEDPAREAEGR